MLPLDDFDVMWICRMCERLAQAKGQGGDSCGQDCSGPWRQDAFSRYKGPLTSEGRKNFCLFCGSNSTKVIQCEGLEIITTGLGVCDTCVPLLEKLLLRSGG